MLKDESLEYAAGERASCSCRLGRWLAPALLRRRPRIRLQDGCGHPSVHWGGVVWRYRVAYGTGGGIGSHLAVVRNQRIGAQSVYCAVAVAPTIQWSPGPHRRVRRDREIGLWPPFSVLLGSD
jgi:hypothetical protein